MVKVGASPTDQWTVTVQPRPEAGRGSALEALVEAAAGILAADSLEGTLGRIAHHLRALLHYDDLTVYEIDDAAGLLRPVFAVGDWVDEVLENPIPLGTGVTGLGGRATGRRATCRTSCQEPLVERRGGHAGRARGVRVRAAAGARPRARRAERLPQRRRRGVHRRGGRAGRALRDDGGARVRLGAPARHAARAGQARRADRAAQPPRVP